MSHRHYQKDIARVLTIQVVNCQGQTSKESVKQILRQTLCI